MKTGLKKLNFRKFIIAFVVAFAMFTSSFVGYNFGFNNINNVQASYKQEVSLITNSNFSSYLSGDIPYTPSSWTLLDPTSTTKVTHGIITTFETDFVENAEDYNLEQNANPGTPQTPTTTSSSDAEYKHLMINSYEGANRLGYQSNSFTLEKNSFYAINVVTKTVNNGRASIYLSGLSNDTQAKIENFTTLDEWEQYTIFIATSEFASESVTLDLWLGGSTDGQTSVGTAFFANVNVIRYSESTYSLELYYRNIYNTSENSKYINVELNGTLTTAVTNGDFESYSLPGDTNIIAGFKTLEYNTDPNQPQQLSILAVDGGYQGSLADQEGILNPNNNGTSSENNNVLYMNNIESGYQGIESSDITLAKHTLYRLSIWAKSDSGIGNGATLKLIEQNTQDLEDFTATEQTLSLSNAVTTNAPTNNWSLYTFYIEGHPLKDTVANLQIWMGTESSPTTGYVFIDSIQIQQVSYSNYQTGLSADSHSAEYTYNTSNDYSLVTNGNFNQTQNETANIVYPLTPSDWTITTNDDNFTTEDGINGIVDTQSSEFSNFQTTLLNSENINHRVNVNNPGLTELLQSDTATVANTSNNILVIGNPVDTTQTYTSGSISLSASSYYKIVFTLNTQYTQYTENSGVNVSMESESYTIFDLQNLNTSNNWQTYTVYLYTKDSAAATLNLSLQNATGFAFFDDVYVTSSSEDIFNSATRNVYTNNYVVNLNTEDFSNYLTNSDQLLNTPYTWNVANNSNSNNYYFGILKTDLLSDQTKNTQFLGLPNPLSETNKNVLLISSSEDSYLTASSTLTYTLESGTYYKISVKIKTYSLAQEQGNTQYDSDDQAIPFGAQIKLSAFDESFSGIDTQTYSETNINNWVTYEFYVSPESSTTTSVQVSLGSTTALTSGFVFVDSVELETLEQADYTTAVNSIGSSSTALSLSVLSTTDDTNTETDTTTDNTYSGGFDWLLVSSVLMAAALLVAMIGTAIRRIKITHKPRVKTSYDRRKTIEVEMNKRERIEFRKEIISDLQLEFAEIDQEITEFLDELKLEEEKLKVKQQQRKDHFEQLKQAILIEITTAQTNYDKQVSTLEKPEDKQKVKAEFDKLINKLRLKQASTELKAEVKLHKYAAIEQKREKFLQQQQYRKQLIQEEIDRIEHEIEAIAKEEEIMWSEYRKAKEEAKRAKLEYYAKKRAEKRATKQGKPAKQDEVTTTEESNVDSDQVIEVKDTPTDTDKK